MTTGAHRADDAPLETPPRSDAAPPGGSGRRRTPTGELREAARQRARAMRRSGDALQGIAARLGISRSTAHNWTRDVLDLPPTSRRARRDEQVRAARRPRGEGLRYAEIADQMGVAVATVHGWTCDVVARGDEQRDLGGRTRAERRETSRRAWEPRLRATEIRRQQTKRAAAHQVGGTLRP